MAFQLILVGINVLNKFTVHIAVCGHEIANPVIYTDLPPEEAAFFLSLAPATAPTTAPATAPALLPLLLSVAPAIVVVVVLMVPLGIVFSVGETAAVVVIL